MNRNRFPFTAGTFCLTLAAALGAAQDARAQTSAPPPPPSWTLSLPPGGGGDTTIAVENRCAGAHDFSIDVAGIPWVQLRGEAKLRVEGGTAAKVPARVETGGREIGADDGVLAVVCDSCPADPLCSQRVDRVPSRLRVVWPEEALATLPGPEASGEEILAVLDPRAENELKPILRRWRNELGLRQVARFELSLRPVLLIRLRLADPIRSVGGAIRALQEDPQVLWAQPIFRYRTAAESAEPPPHDDPYASRQWGARRIGADAAHASVTGEGIRIALLDSGVDTAHPDLAGQVEAAVDLVDDAKSPPPEVHGTAVAGVIAAVADNGLGIYGIAPGATLLAARVCAESSAETGEASGDTVALARGLDWAAEQRARIVNVSLSGPRDPLVRSLLAELAARDVAVIAAAGNRTDSAESGEDQPRYPAAYPSVLAVSSLGLDGLPYPGALHGDWVDLLAPGEDIVTTVPGAAFRPMTGSSFAAPHASGALALLLAHPVDSGAAATIQRLRECALPAEGAKSLELRAQCRL